MPFPPALAPRLSHFGTFYYPSFTYSYAPHKTRELWDTSVRQNFWYMRKLGHALALTIPRYVNSRTSLDKPSQPVFNMRRPGSKSLLCALWDVPSVPSPEHAKVCSQKCACAKIGTNHNIYLNTISPAHQCPTDPAHRCDGERG